MKRLFACLLILAATASVGRADALATLQADDAGTYSASIRGMTVTLVMSPETDGMRTATVTVSENGETVFENVQEELFSIVYGPHLRIVEMDTSNDTPELYVSTYTGGAHCCNDVFVASKTADGWKEVDVGFFDGDPERLYPRDLDGDGQAEVKTYDNSFLYEFASYAGSYAPTQILGFRDGAVVDISGEKNFEWELRGAIDAMGEIPEAGERRNSWLAAYAAMLIRLGEDDPLDYAISAHDASVDWGMLRCTVPEVDYSCPEGKQENIGFKAALTAFLTENGYLEAKQ